MDGIFGVKDKDKFTCVNFACGQFADEVTLCLGENQEIKIDGDKVTVVTIKPKYPKTYEECCKNYPDNEKLKIGNLLCDLEQLIICRNAYWKVAGEEMGIGKPWEPDWMDETTKYGIGINRNFVFKDDVIYARRILIFPTEEIRDAFYDNFKELIEMCKELL